MAQPIELSFKSRGKSQVDVGLDFYLPKDASPSNRAPIMIWWHGGGLLMGTRKAIWKHLTSAPDKHFLCVVSADYRLAPQARIDSIMEDVQDTFDFIRNQLPAEIADKVDTSRIASNGGSAGGWLSLLAGSGIVSPPPKVVAAIYPITRSTDPFFNTPQKPKVSYEPAPIPTENVEPYLNPKGPVVSGSDRSTLRRDMYAYMLQEAILTSLLFDDTTEDPKDYEIVRRLDRLQSIPPHYIVHGTIDDKVAVAHSHEVVAKLKELGATYEYDELPGTDHLFDMDPSVMMDEMYGFIKKHL